MELFVSSRLHLTGKSYDLIKYNGRMRTVPKIPPQAKTIGSKLRNEREAIILFLSNHADSILRTGSPVGFIGNLTSPEARILGESLESCLEQRRTQLYFDVSLLVQRRSMRNFDSVLNLLLEKRIHLYTVSLLLKFANIRPHWEENIVFGDLSLMLEKFSLFFPSDKKVLREVVAKVREEEG